MKNTIKLAGLALALAFGVSTAQAGEIKPYVGVGVGLFETDLGFGLKSKSAVGYYIHGGADFNDYIGAQLRIGSVSSKTINAATAAKFKTNFFVSELAKFQYPVTSDAKVFALLGATTYKGSISGPTTSNSSTTKTTFSYGAGFSYTVEDTIDIGFEYMAYSPKTKATQTGGVVTTTDIKLTSIAINGSYKF